MSSGTSVGDEFERLVGPFRADLLRYCRKLAGTAWDGEDLLQETLLKAYRRYGRWPEREIGKAYLYRIAVNTWYDICRRKKLAFLPEFVEEQPDYAEWTRYDVRESLEYLMDALEPRQVALILLVDVFGFTPLEAGRAIGQPAGAIKSALHRARTRLKKAADRNLHRLFPEETSPNTSDAGDSRDAELLDQFVRAFQAADTASMVHAYRDLSSRGVTIDRITQIRGQLYFYVVDPDGHRLMITRPEWATRSDGEE